MKCELCERIATEKHHISYFPEITIPVCTFHGDEIHRKPEQFGHLILYNPGEGHYFYEQKKRISNFLGFLSKQKKEYWKKQKK